jgi:hypothetical protein
MKFIPCVVAQPTLPLDGLSLRPPQSCCLPTEPSPLPRAMMTFPPMWHKPPRQHTTTIEPLPMLPGVPSMERLSSGPPQSLPLHPTHAVVSQRIPSQAATADAVAWAGGQGEDQ